MRLLQMSRLVWESIHKSKARSTPLVSFIYLWVFPALIAFACCCFIRKAPSCDIFHSDTGCGISRSLFFLLQFSADILSAERVWGAEEEEVSVTWALTRFWGGGEACLSTCLIVVTKCHAGQSDLKKGGLVFLSLLEGTVHHGLVVRAALAAVAGVWGSRLHRQEGEESGETAKMNVGAQLAFCSSFIFIQSRLPAHAAVPPTPKVVPPSSANPLWKHPHSHTHLEVHLLGDFRSSLADHEDGPSVSIMLVSYRPAVSYLWTHPSMAHGFYKLLTISCAHVLRDRRRI